MTRTSLDDAQWVSLMLVMQQIPFVWKRDDVALRRFVEAALWICRTGAPWRDLPDGLGLWSSVYHRWRRWCLRGWWELIFEALRPSLPAGQHHLQSPPRRERRCRQHGGSRSAWP
jgi:transposase